MHQGQSKRSGKDCIPPMGLSLETLGLKGKKHQSGHEYKNTRSVENAVEMLGGLLRTTNKASSEVVIMKNEHMKASRNKTRKEHQ